MAKIIKFDPTYRPRPAQETQEIETFEQMPAVELLKDFLENAAQGVEDVVILCRDSAGVTAIVSNLETEADNLLFLEQIKSKIVEGVKPQPPTPPRIA